MAVTSHHAEKVDKLASSVCSRDITRCQERAGDSTAREIVELGRWHDLVALGDAVAPNVALVERAGDEPDRAAFNGHGRLRGDITIGNGVGFAADARLGFDHRDGAIAQGAQLFGCGEASTAGTDNSNALAVVHT